MTIYVHGIEFYAYHGCSQEEQTIGHRYGMDIEVEVPQCNGVSDELASTVDYGALAVTAVEFCTSRQVKLLEHLAHQLANDLLQKFPLIEEITLRIWKRLPPFPAIAEEAGVQYYAKRTRV